LDFHQPFICSAASSGKVKSEGPPADEALLDKVTEKYREKELSYARGVYIARLSPPVIKVLWFGYIAHLPQ
jgi:hypothetical protein